MHFRARRPGTSIKNHDLKPSGSEFLHGLIEFRAS